MAKLYISEFSNLPLTTNGAIQAASAVNWVDDQEVSIGGTAASSEAFNAATNYVLLSSDSVCSIAWGSPGETATATASNMRIPANFPILFGVAPGMTVSVITNT